MWLAMYQEMAKKQRAKLQLKKGKGKPPKADAKALSADDPLDQLVVGFFLATSWKFIMGWDR